MQCDHGNDQEVQKLFDKVSKEQNERLDILVNNAFKGVKVQSVSNSQAATNNRCNVFYMMHRLGMAESYSQSCLNWHSCVVKWTAPLTPLKNQNLKLSCLEVPSYSAGAYNMTMAHYSWRESHTCGSETSILRQRTNFSRQEEKYEPQP